ncbi:cation diffusion facilitator family transporter [Chitinimonas viridis]|uniref:Cation diffusion facilitator family transporter n=1 Tax=Chitinimonas viridis TaxID=664880 RepID=A0ABT8B4A8_9NEIS|nr:cation diffusion facilitator family transporter [Chitinimonas viridis]MDN3576496.1 cation diffusion facilitator family transporter [Chitinimonas viridis]
MSSPHPAPSGLQPRHLAMLSIAAACLTLGLKFWAYHLTGSVGLYSDAMESFVNLAAAIAALVALTIAAQPADPGHPFGHEKAEYFASGLEGGLIFVAALAIAYEAVQRLLHPAPVAQLGMGMLISLVASAINGGLAWLMLGYARKHDSIVLEADAKHLLTDVWTSAGVVAALCLLLVLPPSWWWLDPLIAIVVAANIVRTGADLLRRSADGLMDAALPAEEQGSIRRILEQQLAPGLRYTGLRTRKAGNRRFVEFKLLVAPAMTVADSHALCDTLEAAIMAELNRCQVTIHVEPLTS